MRNLNGVTRFVTETIGFHWTLAVKLGFSASYSLELESRYLVEVVRVAERSFYLSGASPEPPACATGPSLYVLSSLVHVTSSAGILLSLVLSFFISPFFACQTFSRTLGLVYDCVSNMDR